ncbi:AAA-ATPase Vps4-associated 1 family protein [Aspergillus neoniger CBS 115656]|uniref:DUF1742-domain-containing protein n=1 Tax=Aspergillus neoniger (strain CBS 115656) TaxID=1448310 RepID=A0A318ZKJ1_ASPNB|nr:DUF1742-domain-containing protein [Aspergillus neoniger CBS 115656]PYH36472.1 DUF1742-domain-containing protein [Aspergillus neoniger CBS 115656]
MSMSLQNIWHLRRVADTAAKACYICYKPSSSVLITPDNRDFFYVCPSHLQDRHFCSPIVDTEAAAAKAKEEAMAREIERVKKDYEEKQQRKKNKDAEKEKDKKEDDKDKEKDDKSATKKGDEEDKKLQRERDDKVCSSLHISIFYVPAWLDMYSLTYHRSKVSRNRPLRRMTRRGYLRCISISLALVWVPM